MKLVAILGPTGCGKTKFALDFANERREKFDQKWVVFNMDSRQIYQKMPLSSNLDLNFRGVPHFLFDFVDPERVYSVMNYLNDFLETVRKVKKIGDATGILLVGGTGLYLKMILQQEFIHLPRVEFAQKIENMKNNLLEKKLDELQAMFIEKFSQDKYNGLNYSERNNKKRLQSKILAFESEKNQWENKINFRKKFNSFNFDISIILMELEINCPNNLENITKRLEQRLFFGLIDELEFLYNLLGEQRMASLGMFQGIYCQFKNGKVNKKEMLDLFILAEKQYQKRQLTYNKGQFKNWQEKITVI